ncbi:ABC transporter permease [Phytoactinopolyspora alkaliphila]|uniref:ABC transporter permease n=1 Tax=Phytoactinopolyspora alkaliphila TaxID=1783498 RepID=UPI001C204402|nr:ABC transporter permease [Phytoactinopolyspora alkaliphila]
MTPERTEPAPSQAAGTQRPVDRTGKESGPSPWHTTIRIGVGLALLIGVLVTAFAWPAAESGPRDIPIAVVGPPDAAAGLERQLNAAMPDAFELTVAADGDQAQQLIEDREAYGAVVFESGGPPRVLIASAASPAVAQVISAMATHMSQPDTPAPAVTDLAPLSDDDPRGAGFAAAALPMVMGGMIVGVAMCMVISGTWRRVTGALVAAVLAGPVVGLVVQSWLGVLDGHYWVNAGVVSMTIAAISLTLIGLHALIGPPGIGIGAAVMFLLGNPLSGVTSAPEMLPAGWGAVGQALPPGAGGSLLRSTSFFDGAAAAGPVVVLSSWILGGILLAAIGWRSRERTTSGSTSRVATVGS